MFAVGLVDFLYVGGSFLDSISNEFALVNIIGLLMVLMAYAGEPVASSAVCSSLSWTLWRSSSCTCWGCT